MIVLSSSLLQNLMNEYPLFPSLLFLLHLHHGKVTLVLEVVPDHLLSRGWLHPKQDHVATVGVILIRDALCRNTGVGIWLCLPFFSLLLSSGVDCNVERTCVPAPCRRRYNPLSQFYGAVPSS